ATAFDKLETVSEKFLRLELRLSCIPFWVVSNEDASPEIDVFKVDMALFMAVRSGNWTVGGAFTSLFIAMNIIKEKTPRDNNRITAN
ncbi:MAG: hypothetical protein NO515_07200, partial [Candidatus Methanomethylicia archaeon]|nr:hypothetical protein [Candidatus Methanomethylicia archaeon]